MVSRRLRVVFAVVFALATQIHSKFLDLEDILEEIERRMEVPAGIMRAMDENMAQNNVGMQSMPLDADMGQLERLPPPDAMDDMRMALAMDNHDQMLRSRMQSSLLNDMIDTDLFLVDRIDLDSVPIGPIVNMDPNDVYKMFGIRRPNIEMRSKPLDINQLSDYQIVWRPRRRVIPFWTTLMMVIVD